MRSDYFLQSGIKQGVFRAARRDHSPAKSGVPSHYLAWFATTQVFQKKGSLLRVNTKGLSVKEKRRHRSGG
jgi:hypothetical protein